MVKLGLTGIFLRCKIKKKNSQFPEKKSVWDSEGGGSGSYTHQSPPYPAGTGQQWDVAMEGAMPI